jgi:YbbR domain-containing protein
MPDRFQWLKNFFAHNWLLKLLAVVMAVLIFYAIRSATSDEVTYEVPVEIKLEEDIAVHSQDPMTAKVTFRGAQEDLRRLDVKQIKAVVQSNASDPGESERVTISSRNITGASGVMVKKISPETVTLTYDREITKKFNIAEPKLIGAPLMGKAAIEFEPKFVIIRGSRRKLEKMESDVLTEPVDVDGRVESFTKSVRVLPPVDTWVSSIEPGEITVKVNIVTESASRELLDVPVLAVVEPGIAANVRFQPEMVKVTLHGRPEILDKIRDNDVKAFADCSMIGISATNVPVIVFIPQAQDISTAADPEFVTVICDKQE